MKTPDATYFGHKYYEIFADGVSTGVVLHAKSAEMLSVARLHKVR
jgi:hypothetical protein